MNDRRPLFESKHPVHAKRRRQNKSLPVARDDIVGRRKALDYFTVNAGFLENFSQTSLMGQLPVIEMSARGQPGAYSLMVYQQNVIEINNHRRGSEMSGNKVSINNCLVLS